MIEFNNKVKAKVSEKWVKVVAGKVLRGLKKRGDVSVVLVGDKEISDLNWEYKKRKGVTDVLSFSNLEGGKIIAPGDENFLGEVIIGYNQAKRQAKKQGQPILRELMILLIHGVLHLLGYDDEGSEREREVMREKEGELLKKVNKVK